MWEEITDCVLATIINRDRRHFETIKRNRCHLQLIVSLLGLLGQIVVKGSLRK